MTGRVWRRAGVGGEREGPRSSLLRPGAAILGPMAEISIRPARVEDAGFILQIVRELAAYERAPDAVFMTEDLVRRHIFGVGLGPGERGPIADALIGEVDGVAQGCAVFFHNYSTWVGKPGLYLEDLFVRPESRGVGLGKALLKRVAEIAVERGCERMEWLVIDWNEPAIGFYKSLGAEALDQWTMFRLSGAELKKLGARKRV